MSATHLSNDFQGNVIKRHQPIQFIFGVLTGNHKNASIQLRDGILKLAPYLVPVGCALLIGFITGFIGAFQHIGSEKQNFFIGISEVVIMFICAPFFFGSWMVAIKRVREEKLSASIGFQYCRQWLSILGTALMLCVVLSANDFSWYAR